MPVELTYAIGDIHGCADLLRKALARVVKHAGAHSHSIVCLGDYVDRGPDSRGVIDLLQRASRRQSMVCLLGNHEEMMLAARAGLGTPAGRRWLALGGAATLASYAAEGERGRLEDVPAEHWRWLQVRPRLFEDRHQVFVHAGVEPSRPLSEQDPRSLIWIRDRFLAAHSGRFFERRHIVHGHTPVWAGKPEAAIPELLAHRSNLDTGAYATGVLSVGVFDSAQPGGPIDLLSIV